MDLSRLDKVIEHIQLRNNPNITTISNIYPHYDILLDIQNKYVPLYSATYTYYTVRQGTEIREFKTVFYERSPFITGTSYSLIAPSHIEATIQYNGLVNRCGVKAVSLENMMFDFGKYYIRDHKNNKILLMGLVSTECTIQDKKFILNQKKYDQLLIERKFPLLFYISADLLFNPLYKVILNSVKDTILKIVNDPLIRVIISEDPISDFFKGFEFPKFKRKTEEIEYFENLLREVISEVELD